MEMLNNGSLLGEIYLLSAQEKTEGGEGGEQVGCKRGSGWAINP